VTRRASPSRAPSRHLHCCSVASRSLDPTTEWCAQTTV
jgi:hypothetical protein